MHLPIHIHFSGYHLKFVNKSCIYLVRRNYLQWEKAGKQFTYALLERHQRLYL